MFSYLVKKNDTQLGVDLSGRLHAKTEGYWWITNPKDVNKPGFLPVPQVIDGFDVVFSPVNVPEAELLHYHVVNGNVEKLQDADIKTWAAVVKSSGATAD